MISIKEIIKLKCDLLINGLRLNELRKDLIESQGWEKDRAAGSSLWGAG